MLKLFDLVLSICTSGLLWYSFYFLVRKLTRNQSAEFSNRIVTFLHGLFISFQGVQECFIDGWAFNNDDLPTTDIQFDILLTSAGYFVFDLGWCLYYKTETNIMIVHHIYSIFAIERIIDKGIKGNQAVCALGGMEITNPLLQARWFIRSFGYHHSKLFSVVELGFIFVFIIVRICLGSVIGWQVILSRNHDWEFKGLALLIYVVSWVFAVNMIKYFIKKYSNVSNEGNE